MSKLFPSLKNDFSPSGKGILKKIAIVTSDITGPIRNGGVGTAYAHLARALTKAGHEVTIVFAGQYLPIESSFDSWQEYYWLEKIKLISLPEPDMKLEGFDPARISYATYLFLKENQFDIIHFPDMHGLGFYSLQAKKMGLAFENSTLCVILHGPTLWHKQGNKELLSTLKDLQYDYFERKSVEFADVLVCPSQYGLQWALDAGWTLPRRSYVEQYLFPKLDLERYENTGAKFKEIVFFGRLETRKGIELFCDALELLPVGLLKDKTITFLGVEGVIQYGPAAEYFKKRSKKWKFKTKFIHDFGRNEALDYLRSTASLVVLSSRAETLGYTAIECIGAGIPFIASKIPAYEELIATENHDILFELDARSLTAKIQEALGGIPREIEYRADPSNTAANWMNWHSRVEPDRSPAKNVSTSWTPLVSVCVTHRNRSHYLEQCLESLEKQTYGNFEVILVDDASDAKSSRRYLDTLQEEFSRKNWKILRESKQSGPSTARNKAANAARGEYLLFMDDDNIAKPDEIATFVEVARRTGADFLTCCFDRFSRILANGHPDVEGRWLCTGDDLSIGIFYNTFGDMNSFIKRAVFLSLGGLREVENSAYEDYELFCRAVLAGYKLLAIPEALFFYRDHPGGYSKSADPLKTVETRLKPFSDFFGREKMGSFLSFALAMRFQLFPETNHDAPIFPERRTNYFSELPDLEEPIFIAEKKKDFEKLKASPGSKLTACSDHAVFLALGESPKISIILPKNISGRVFIELNVVSIGAGEWEVKFRSSSGQIVGSKLGMLKAGSNRLRTISIGKTTKSIELSLMPSTQSFSIRNIKISPLKTRL
jgi:glycosyltransferase involved in cell wall biosynthesis